MSRFHVRVVLAALFVMIATVPAAHAQDQGVGQRLAASATIAPSVAVARAWKAETRPSTPLRGLYVSYGVLQGLDMYSTIAARNNGAREMNPLLDSGYGQAAATKALFAAGTYVAVQKLAKKNKKAAVITMAILNVTSALVVTHNFKNASR